LEELLQDNSTQSPAIPTVANAAKRAIAVISQVR
jgi:hypothetical protein